MENNIAQRPSKNNNPWKGLKSYDENDIIFGRDEEISQLYTRIIYNTQTVVYGKSGVGKSSVINAGVIRRAKMDGMLPVWIRLAHTTKSGQPTIPYIEQIKARIEDERIKMGAESEEVVKHNDEHEETLWELMHRKRYWLTNGEQRQQLIPLVIFDQFEEIFTLEIDSKRVLNFFAELADLLNDVKPEYITKQEQKSIEEQNKEHEPSEQGTKNKNIFTKIANLKRDNIPEYIEKSDFHIVVTLREDFLSYLERYTAYIPSMKQNRFALLPLNEEQAAKIIMEPVKGLIDIQVATEIIQKVTGKNNFKIDGTPELEVDSAILSLYLEQLYNKKSQDSDIITSEMVVQYSDDIIKNFYEESIREIDERTIEYLEDELITNANRRNNVARTDLIQGGVSEKYLDLLLNRKILRQFNYGGDERIEFIHDILCPIVNNRIEHREQLAKEREEQKKREEEEARREKERQIQEEKLRKAEEERQFLLKKQKLQEKENRLIQRQKEEENARLREDAIRVRNRNRKRLYAVGAFVLFLLSGICWYLWYYKWERTSYYAQFERINGWPNGVGDKLRPEEMRQLPLYYKLSHNGYKAYDTDVEVCSSNNCLPLSPRIYCMEVCETDSDRRAKEYLNLLSQIKSIHFEAGEGDRLIKEVIKGENDSVLYYVNYFYMETDGQVWAQFVSSKGQVMSVRENGLDRIKLTWHVSKDKGDRRNGRVTSMVYYDDEGVHQAGANGVYGYLIDYSENGDSTTLYYLDKFGLPFNASYNAVTIIRRKDTIETLYERAARIPDNARTRANGPNGFWREVKEKNVISYYTIDKDSPSAMCYDSTDTHGNTLQLKMEGNVPHSQPKVINFTYDKKTGYCASEEKLNVDNKPFYGYDSIYMKKWEYDDNGHVILEEHYVTEERIAYAHYITRNGNVVREELRDEKNKEYPYIVRLDTVMDNYTSSSYYDKNNTPINYKSIYEKVPYHRIITELSENQRTTKYYRYDSVTGKEQPQLVTKDGNIAVSFFCKKEELDKDNNVVSSQILDNDGNIVKSMLYYYQNGQNIGRAVMGIDGTPVRCDKWEEEGLMYYKLYFTKDFDDRYSGVQAVDEWGHRSSFKENSDYSYIDWFDFKDMYVKIYENKEDLRLNRNPKGDTKIFKKYKQITYIQDTELTDYEIPYIHILSPLSKLYNNREGLQDGDRIIEFGKWKLGQSLSDLRQEWEYVFRNEGIVHVEVMRPFISTYERKIFNLICSPKEHDLIEYHVLKMTHDEKEMIDNYYKIK